MPSSSRSRSTIRRSPRRAPLPPEHFGTGGSAQRSLVVGVAAVFGLLVSAEDLYLAWLLGAGWSVVTPLVLAALAALAAGMTWWGRARGWLLLLAAGLLPLVGLLGLAVLFGALGAGAAAATALLLAVGPVGALAFSLTPAVRAWTRPGRATGSRRVGRSG